MRAPFAGVVASRDVEPGETVAPGQPLMRVYEPRELRIEVAVPQTRAEAIRRDPRARVVLADDPALTSARLFLSRGIGQIIRNGLALMGVVALTEMQ